MIRTLPLAVVALMIVALAAPAGAQGVTTAAIGGTVLDSETGEGLPGATVVAVHEPSGTRYGAATRADGRFDLRNLRVGGPYTVTASYVGYQSVAETDVVLALGQTQTVDFTLGEDVAERGEVEVVAGGAGAVISTSRTGAATNVTEATIEALPTISRSLADFARLSPLSGGQGTYSVAGRNNRYNNIQIDGATLNDVFGLAGSGTPGGQAGTQPISLDAIAEFNVEVAPYDVRYNGFTGGTINAVTKSGTNQFEGTLRVLGRNEEFVGDFEGEPFGDFAETLYIGTLGGPILRDKLFFFLSGELSRQTFPDDTGVLGSNAPTIFPVAGETLQELGEVALETYGYDPGGFDLITDDRDSNKLLAKLDYNIDGNNRLSLRHNFVDANDDQGVGRGTSSFDLGARRYVFNSQQNSTTLQLSSTLGPRLVNEARLVYTAVRDSRDVEGTPFSETEINLTDDARVFLGIDRFSQANGLDQDLFEFTNNATLFAGDHTLLFGTSNQIFRFDNLFIQDYYGSYRFGPVAADLDGDGMPESLSAVDAFRLGLPNRYRFSYASEYVFDEQGRLRFDEDGNPLRTATPGALPRAQFTGFQLGVYVQDEWDVTDDLRITAGVRVDVPIFPDEPVENPLVSGGTGVNPDGSTFAIEPAFGPEFSTSNTASGNLLWSPRLGFNYQTPGLRGETLQLRGGTGIFSGRTPYVWISNQYSNTGADLARLDVSLTPDDFDLDGDGVLEPDELGFFPGTGNPEDQPIPGDNAALQPVQTTEINLIAEDFKLPQVWRTNLALDQELPLGFTATLEGLYTKSLNEVTFRNLNIAQSGTSLYGRPLYRDRVNPNFTNALLLDNSSEGYEYSLVAQLQRQVRTGLGGSLSYTYNRAENVNNATSSRAISNWQFNENVDINDPGLGTADFEVRHRVLAYASYRHEYLGRFSSELGFVLDTQAGEPFSWIYAGDANFDGQSFNDLLYVPAAEDEVFLTSENWNLLDTFIEGTPGLAEARGDFAVRNASRAPWQTRLDLEFNQGITTLRGQRLDLELTLVNVLNFLNDDWGRIRFTSFNNITGLSFQRYIEAGDVGNVVAGRVVTADDLGKPVVSFNESTLSRAFTGDQFGTASLSSRWQLRFGVKYSF
ncbi:MAG: carboxypeptidase regulatory-like domain-containing protein [Rubricoccaceae bacterium]|nr:carboxypeptidase regulatory-like domain-containing protein [Rubricoccaceae bacterium]